ncbi:hypothetical protein L914_01196 [Phytophthora nicotianae]|uniref:Uncharacterized protein n=1 Tax=Phytophthora nicotianae TaxID=4792 RepID=W2P3P5_PHYNI|nr:hypothetical protein L914_01196 [Phytophthora nicotianae]
MMCMFSKPCPTSCQRKNCGHFSKQWRRTRTLGSSGKICRS